MSKRDIVLIVITVLLVGVMIGGFIYDRTPALLDRTNPYEFSEDENLKIIASEKKGIVFNRVYYEVKLQILDGYWEGYYINFAEAIGNDGVFMDKAEYERYRDSSLTNAILKPVPSDDAIIWMIGIEDDKAGIIYIIDQEADGNSYLYVYYSKK